MKIPNSFSQRVRHLTLWLVGLPSVTGTPGEASCARAIHAHLAGLPYFQEHPDQLVLAPTIGDDRQRYSVIALARGASGDRAVLLCGHIDTVDTANYGRLEPLARDPLALGPRLPEAWADAATDSQEGQALADLATGEYLFGRGALDMKSGVAAGLAVLERFIATSSERKGALVAVFTPDEEDGSRGMISAVSQLPALLEGWGVKAVAALNLDSSAPRGPGDISRTIFVGSVGKLLVSVYIRGVESHTGRSLEGFNPTLLASEVTRRIECRAELADADGPNVAAPPTCLRQVDLKPWYDVTQPAATWAYYNVLNLTRSPAETLDLVVGEVREAADEVARYLKEQSRAFATRAGRPAPPASWQPKVYTYDELRRAAMERDSAATRAALDELASRYQGDPSVDARDYSLKATEALWRLSGLKAPAAVVGIASLYYPAVTPPRDGAPGCELMAACRLAADEIGAPAGYQMELCPYFWGISDMSFIGGRDTREALAAVIANTPALDGKFKVDYAAASRLGIPVVNIGPFGKDAHKPTERVHAPYSFDVVPRMIWRIATRMAGEE